MSVGASARDILLLLIRRPATGTTHSIHLGRINWIIFISNFITIITKKSMHMHTYLEFFLIMTKMIILFLVIFKQGFELCWIATNDGEDHRQSIFACSQYRFRCTSYCDPYIKVIINSTR